MLFRSRDPALAWSDPVITHLRTPGDFAVSTEQWRYIHYLNGDEELYNIPADPYEWKNLAPVPGYAAQLVQMRALSPKTPRPAYESQPGISAILPEDFLPLIKAGKGSMPPSKPGGQPVDVIFRNQTKFPMKLFSVDEQGGCHFEHLIPLTSRYWVKTTAGHTWLVCHEDGRELGYFVAEDKSAIGSIQMPEN